MVEGCLSYPGLMLSIRRPKWVVGKFTNAKGETIEQRFEGLSARCYLHELDHMNGIRMIDHVSPFALKRAKGKQETVEPTINNASRHRTRFYLWRTGVCRAEVKLSPINTMSI